MTAIDAPPLDRQGRPALVLVVDDYADNREMYAKFLKFKGLRVAEAEDGLGALEKAFDLHPSVILMDLSLPGIDGWQATRELKADRRTRNIPVVVVTGHALGGAADSAKAAGCDAFLTKPCSPEEVLAEIHRVLASMPPDSD
ncbi:MAG TPA: response regulator [Methylomirabilota bacterium]|jgi:CheY-like chemotaxis protein|nr:response regulator [Methylomirabilota bacterium]